VFAANSPNLFGSLYKWAKRQDENFCSEGLIYALRLLLAESPHRALPVIRMLTNGLIGSAEDRVGAIQISGQVVSNRKRPDIEIACGTKLAWVEVKVDSPVADQQLANYKSELLGRNSKCSLSLLWRGGDPLPDNNRPDHYLRWVELSHLLRPDPYSMTTPGAFVDRVLVDYLHFLESRQLAMSRVSSTITKSIQDVASLIRLLGELVSSLGLTPGRKTNISVDPDSPYLGRRVCKGDKVIGWVGVHLFEPQWLFFTTDGHDKGLRLNMDIAMQLVADGLGDLTSDRKNWTLSLDLENVPNLFSREPSGQISWLRENLLEPAVSAANRLYGLK